MAFLTSLNLYFNEFSVGDEFATPGRTVTETDIVMFAGLSGDYSLYHTNEVYAAASHFGGRVAHGALILAIGTGLEYMILSPGDRVVAFYGMDRVRFVRPVHIGDTLRLVGQVARLEAKSNGNGIVTLEQKFLNQADAVAAVITKRILFAGSDSERS